MPWDTYIWKNISCLKTLDMSWHPGQKLGQISPYMKNPKSVTTPIWWL